MAISPFDNLLEQADVFARAGQWQEAYDYLGRAAELQPQHAGTVTGQGTCLIQLGRPQEALAYFKRVTELMPASPDAHNNLGVVQAIVGDAAAAETAYKQALTCDGEHVPTWKNLAQLYLQHDRISEGVPILANLVKAHPDDVEALVLMAGCYEEGEDTASALVLYREALKYQPENAEAKAAVNRLAPPADLTHIARPEHAKKLAALKGLKAPKPGEPQGPKA